MSRAGRNPPFPLGQGTAHSAEPAPWSSASWPRPPLTSWPSAPAHQEDEELRELENEVIECHIIRFCKPMMQKTAYELWLKDQKRDMHLKCARYLEDRAHKCDHCHGGDFVPYHHFTVDIRLNSLDMDSIRKMANFQEFKRKCAFVVALTLLWVRGRQAPRGPGRREGRAFSGGACARGRAGVFTCWSLAAAVSPRDGQWGVGDKDSGPMGCGHSSQ